MKDYWKPQFKWQLVDWLSRRYKESKSKFNRKNKKQLYAIYHSIRKKEGK